MPRALELLVRLEKHALEERRLALRTHDVALEALRSELAGLQDVFVTEHAAVWGLPGGPGRLTGHAGTILARLRRLQSDEASTASAREQALTALQEQLLRQKTLELAALGQRTRAQAALCRRAQAAADEAGAVRAAPGHGPSA